MHSPSVIIHTLIMVCAWAYMSKHVLPFHDITSSNIYYSQCCNYDYVCLVRTYGISHIITTKATCMNHHITVCDVVVHPTTMSLTHHHVPPLYPRNCTHYQYYHHDCYYHHDDHHHYYYYYHYYHHYHYHHHRHHYRYYYYY